MARSSTGSRKHTHRTSEGPVLSRGGEHTREAEADTEHFDGKTTE
jgi:hypothetical protein